MNLNKIKKIKNSPLVIPTIVLIFFILISDLKNNTNNLMVFLVCISWIHIFLQFDAGDILKMTFNPYSPIITLFIGWILSLLVTSEIKGTEFLKDEINFFINHKEILLTIIICWLIMSFVYTIQETEINQHKRTILELEAKNEEQKENQKQIKGLLEHKYGELYKTAKSIRFKSVLESFVNNNDEIIGAQIYKYTALDDNNNIVYKITCEESYVYEGIDLNCMVQSYYVFNKKEFEQLKFILELQDKSNHFNNNPQIQETFLTEIDKLLKKFKNRFGEIKNIETIKEEDYTRYQMYNLLLDMLYIDNIPLTLQHRKKTSEKNDILIKLMNGKRANILNSIILEDEYVFKHIGESKKKGRIYLSFPITIYQENYIILFSILPRNININQISFEGLKNDILERFQETV